MQERDKILNLYDIYKDLLTTNEQNYFKLYYFKDLTFNEISEECSVSKSYVSKVIKNVVNKLNNYEDKINMYKIKEELKNIIKDTKDNRITKLYEKL
jgi:predicted DNA-binding protein YlxM (UPF0122 family)